MEAAAAAAVEGKSNFRRFIPCELSPVVIRVAEIRYP